MSTRDLYNRLTPEQRRRIGLDVTGANTDADNFTPRATGVGRVLSRVGDTIRRDAQREDEFEPQTRGGAVANSLYRYTARPLVKTATIQNDFKKLKESQEQTRQSMETTNKVVSIDQQLRNTNDENLRAQLQSERQRLNNQAIAEKQEAEKTFDNTQSVKEAAGNITLSALTGLGGLAASAAVNTVARLTAAGVPLVGSTAGRVGVYGGLLAGEAAIGAGAAALVDDEKLRATDVAIGGGLSAALSLGIPVIGRGVSAAISRFKNLTSNVAKGTKKALGIEFSNEFVEGIMPVPYNWSFEDAIKKTRKSIDPSKTPEELTASIREAFPDVTLSQSSVEKMVSDIKSGNLTVGNFDNYVDDVLTGDFLDSVQFSSSQLSVENAPQVAQSARANARQITDEINLTSKRLQETSDLSVRRNSKGDLDIVDQKLKAKQTKVAETANSKMKFFTVDSDGVIRNSNNTALSPDKAVKDLQGRVKKTQERINKLPPRDPAKRELRERVAGLKSDIKAIKQFEKDLPDVKPRPIQEVIDEIDGRILNGGLNAKAIQTLRKRKDLLTNARNLRTAQEEFRGLAGDIETTLKNADYSELPTIRRTKAVFGKLEDLNAYDKRYARQAYVDKAATNPRSTVARLKKSVGKFWEKMEFLLTDLSAPQQNVVRTERTLGASTDFVSEANLAIQSHGELDNINEQFQSALFQILKRRSKGNKKEMKRLYESSSKYFEAKRALEVNKKRGVSDADLLEEFEDLIDSNIANDGAVAARRKNTPTMSDDEARKVIKKYESEFGDDPVMQSFNKKIREFIDANLLMLKEEGIISAKLFNTLKKEYPNYAPMFRNFDYDDVFIANMGIRESLEQSTTIRSLKSDQGEIVDVLSSVFKQGVLRNRAVVNNRVIKKFARFIATTEDADYRSLYRITDKKPAGSSDAYVSFFEGGERKYINFVPQKGNPYSDAGIEFLTQTGIPDWHNWVGMKQVVDASRTLNSLKSSMLTNYSPTFRLNSMLRDGIIESSINAHAMGGSGSGVVKNLKTAVKGAVDRSKGVNTPEARLYQEALESGVGQGYIGSLNDEYLSSLSRKIDGEGLFRQAEESLRVVNDTMEIATRVANYIEMRNLGYTKKQAATIAAEAGINFKKQGLVTRHMKPFFMFFNATLQGNANFARSLSNPGTLASVATGSVTASASQEMVNNMMVANIIQNYPEADIDPTWHNNFASWERESRMIYITGFNEKTERLTYIAAPVPISLRPFWTMVNSGTRKAVHNDLGYEDIVRDVAVSTANVALPTGRLQADEGATVIPEALRPIVQVATNRGYFGQEISVLDENGEIPDWFRERKGFSQLAVALNDLVGNMFGDDPEKMTSIQEALSKVTDPGVLLHFYQSYIGLGPVKDLEDVAVNIQNAVNGEPYDVNKTPISRNFVREANAPRFDERREAMVRRVSQLATVPEQERAVLEYMIRNNDRNATRALSEAGLEDLFVSIADLSASSSKGAKLFLELTSETNDASYEISKQNFVQELKNEYYRPDGKNDFLYLMEYVAVTQGFHKNPTMLRSFLETQGIHVRDINSYFNKDGSLNANKARMLNRKAISINRSQNREADELYNSLPDIREQMRDGVYLPYEEYTTLQSDLYMLLSNEMIERSDFVSKMSQLNKLWIDSFYEENITEVIEQLDDANNATEVQEIINFAITEGQRFNEMFLVGSAKQNGQDIIGGYTVESITKELGMLSPVQSIARYLLDNGYIN